MVVDGTLRDDEPLGDVGIAHALLEERQHLELSPRQPGGILARPLPGTGPQAALPELAQASRDDRGGRARPQP